MALVSPEMEAARAAGAKLFTALFQKDVRDLYERTAAGANLDAKRLRIMLDLGGAPELADIPWEYLYDDSRFLGVSMRTQIVRYLPVEQASRPQPVELPLSILGVVSNPTDAVPLYAEGVKRRLETALQDEVQQGFVELDWLERATTRALRDALKRKEFHVLHFSGHCLFDERSVDSVLLFEDDVGRTRAVTGRHLGALLMDVQTIRLAVLSAGEGSRDRWENAFGAVAADLVRGGLPAVVATQFEMSDDASTLLAESLYSALAEGSPVDAALAIARKAIWADYYDTAWGTPTLFMGVRDGRIFDVRPGQARRA